MPNSSGALSTVQYWNIICRHRRMMFFTLFLVWIIACALAWLLPARYRSQATILIEKPTVPKKYVLPNVESDPQQHLQTLTQQILSRNRLQRIINDLHLYAGGIAALGSGDVVERMRKDISIDLIQTTSKPPELTGFTISYSSYDPHLAQQVTSRLTSLFIEENLQAQQQQSENTTEFFHQQLQEARAGLEEQTKRIKQFKAQYVGELPSELQSNIQILSGLQIRLQQANEGLDRTEQQKMYLTSMLSAYRETPSLATTPGANATGTQADVDAQLAHLKALLAEMQTRYTEKHPAIVQLRDQIAKAEKLKAEIEKDKGDDTGLPVSRGVAEIKSQLKGTELDIQNRKKEIALLQSEMQAYETRLKATPVREQQLSDLTQDYDQSRKSYDDLLEKRNDSALATNLGKTQQSEQFALLDPATLPSSPYFPNRLLVTLGGLAAGFAAAFGSAFIRESHDDRIHVEKEVSIISKSPILIAIPPLITARDVTRSRWRAVTEIACVTVGIVAITTSAVLAYFLG